MKNILSKFNEQYSEFLSLAPAAISLSELSTGNLIYMNIPFEKLFGVKKEYAFGKSLIDLNIISAEMRAKITKEIIENGVIRLAEFEVKNSNNEIKKILLSSSIMEFDTEKYFLSYIVDITEIKQTKQKINDLAAIVEFSEDAIFSKSLDGIIKNWNEGAEKMIGYSAKEIIGKHISLIIPTEFIHQKKRIIERILNNETIQPYEIVLIKKNNEQIYVSFSASPLKEEDGKIIGVSLIARDISEQKKSEKALINANRELEYQNKEIEKRAEELVIANYARGLIEASRDPLFAISPQGKITDMNAATVRVTGVSHENLIGTNFFDYFTDPEKAREGYEEVFAKGFVADYPLTIIDGELTDVLFNGSVYKDNSGNVIGAVVVARVVTEQKKIEKELIEAKVFAELATEIAEEAKIKAEKATQIAEEAVKAKQQFLSNMSHEIRTPMNAIIGFTKVVLKTNLTPKQKEYLTAIKMSGDALIVLINDILDLAKVDAGKMTFEHTPFKMATSIAAMLHLFETKVLEKNLNLIKNYDTTIPEVLIGDPVRLHQIILNLVSNAIKFTSVGEIIVNVKLLDEDEEKVTIEFSVSDTGIGIPENNIENIFENFQQATSDTSRLYGGTGLGLAIVKQLVEPQGGTIHVVSKVGVGTTFSFTLSFKKTNEKIGNDSYSHESELLDADIKTIKILVVEDIALNQLLMKTLLDDFGFEQDIAENGKIAIEKLQRKSYDIILMDLQMPEMNGFEATEYIRKTMNSKIPIIALTADVTTVDLAKCKAVGMNDYLAKPIDEKILYTKIVGLVKKPTKIKLSPIKEIEKHTTEKIKQTDLAYLINRTKANPALMMEMISLYLQQTPPIVVAMKKSMLDKDWPGLHSAVHKMIPSFSIMGINVNYENIAKKISEYASTKKEIEKIPDLVIELERVCTLACSELEEEYNKIKNSIK